MPAQSKLEQLSESDLTSAAAKQHRTQDLLMNYGDRLLRTRPLVVDAELNRAPCLHLLYHELRTYQDKYAYAIEDSTFKRHVDMVAESLKHGSHVFVEFTFDDGHGSAYELALPILSARGLNARFFITVGWIGRKSGYMTWREVRALSDAGHMIGAHGWSHLLLTRCSPRELDAELRQSKSLLEDKLGVPVTTMSLPGGRFNEEVLSACREAGYSKVYTSVPRIAMSDSEFTVGRVNINSGMTLDWIARLVQPGSRELSKLHREYSMKTVAKSILGDSLYDKLWNIVARHKSDVGTETTASHEYSANHK
jgi:peptidoglycan/xylan/chitin deacetylase (PgdA/CDA1 family)